MNWDHITTQGKLYGTRRRKVKFLNVSTDRSELYISPGYAKNLRLYQKRMRRKPTYSEQRFKDALISYFNIKTHKQERTFFRFQRQFQFTCPGYEKGYIADFYLPQHQIVFEIDGPTHATDEQRRYDAIRDSLLASRGIRTIRVDNDNTSDPTKCREIIEHAVHHRDTPRKTVQLSRPREIELQQDFIKTHGVTRISSYKGNHWRKAP